MLLLLFSFPSFPSPPPPPCFPNIFSHSSFPIFAVAVALNANPRHLITALSAAECSWLSLPTFTNTSTVSISLLLIAAGLQCSNATASIVNIACTVCLSPSPECTADSPLAFEEKVVSSTTLVNDAIVAAYTLTGDGCMFFSVITEHIASKAEITLLLSGCCERLCLSYRTRIGSSKAKCADTSDELVFVDIVFLSAAADIFSLSLSLSDEIGKCLLRRRRPLTPKCASLFTNAKKGRVFREKTKRDEK